MICENCEEFFDKRSFRNVDNYCKECHKEMIEKMENYEATGKQLYRIGDGD